MTRQSPHHDRPHSGRGGNSVRRRRSFTLIELLITVSIIAIMASMVLFAVYSAQEQAKVMKTRALIAKLNNIVRARYDSYRTRRAPVDLPAPPVVGTPAYATYVSDLAKIRLDVLRDLMRMEMPDRWSDVYDNPATPFGAPTKITRPSVSAAYLAKYAAGTPTPEYQGAECLYLIVMEAVSREGDTRDVFRADDAADVDGDGFSEFVDAWGTPIRFLRWAPGFQSEMQTVVSAPPKTVNVNGQMVEVEFDATIYRSFSQSAMPYIGGTLAVLDPTDKQIDGSRLVRITGYFHSGPIAKFTGETLSSYGTPFNGNPPTSADTVLVLAPDPFDARGVYPINVLGSENPTFGLYPLVYSAGPDRCFGILSDIEVGSPPVPHSYATSNLNPCPYDSVGDMIGMPFDNTKEPNFTPDGWMDNIHNHALNLR